MPPSVDPRPPRRPRDGHPAGAPAPAVSRDPPPADPRPATIVAILAGGRSRRMGVPKAGILLEGRPLLAHAVAAARTAGLQPVVVAKPASALPALAGVERWGEPDEPVHPLTGVVAALRHAEAPIVVLPVDLPRVPGTLLAHLAGRTEPVVVVEAAGRLHPLLARFTPACADALEAAAAAGAPVVATVRALGAATCGDPVVRPLGDPDHVLSNVNTPADVRDAGRSGG